MSTGTFRVSLSWNTHSLLCHFSSLFLSTSLPTFLSDVLFEWTQSHTCNWNPLTIFMQWNHRFYIMVFNRLSFWVLIGLGMTIWDSSFFRNCRTETLWTIWEPFVQFKIREKHPWRKATFITVVGFSGEIQAQGWVKTEAIVRNYSIIKIVFLKISQNSQQNTCVGVLF